MNQPNVKRYPFSLIALIGAVLIGFSVFGGLVWHAVTVEKADSADAEASFREALADASSRTPMVWRDAAGRFVRVAGRDRGGKKPTELHVLAFYADGGRLVRADVPLWFFKLKGPAVAYALRGTGFDLERLGLTAGDLEGAGAGVVLDETRATGDRILAWTS